MKQRTALLARVLLPALMVGAAATTAALAGAGHTVSYQGTVVSQEVSVIDGRPYVPLADMARALGGHVAASADGYEIVSGGGSGGARTPEGGANETRGLNGKVGDWFFNGYWRFQVQSVEHMSEYHYRFAPNGSGDTPEGSNDELVVFTCQIKNAHQDTEEPILTAHGLATQKTALTDDQGQSYAPIDFDVRGGGLVQGAAKTFAVVFSVPKGAHLQSLIFTVYGFASSTRVSNVRIALQ